MNRSLILFLLFSTTAYAQDALGSLKFTPSEECPIGWRGDGTGRYPGATPPITWGRKIITPLSEFRCLAVRTDAAEPIALKTMSGARAGCFGVTDWLILGPVTSKNEKNPLDGELLPGEVNFEPKEGDKVGDMRWTRSGGPDVFVDKIVNKFQDHDIAYAFTYIYSPKGGAASIRVRGETWEARYRAYINGKPANGSVLKPGWNRLVFKVEAPRPPSTWMFRAFLCTTPKDAEYENTNIRWITPMPGYSYAMPTIVGDRLYVTSEPNDLICLDKNTGKIQWIRSHPTWSAIPAADKAEFADRVLFDTMYERLHELNAAFPRDPAAKTNVERRKIALELSDKIKKSVEKYHVSFGWGGGNTAATVCTDGKLLYVWHGETGVLACCDLDGTPKYIRFHQPGSGGEHGLNATPVISGDKLVVLAGRCVLAFDRATGAEAWRHKYLHPCYSSLVLAHMDKTPVVVAANGSVYRVSDGKLILKNFGREDGECASPVADGNCFYLISRNGFCAAQVPQSLDADPKAAIVNRILGEDLSPSQTYPVGSPVCHEGLVYATHSGWSGKLPATLFAIDPLGSEPVYRQALDFTPAVFYGPQGAGTAASPTIAGKYLYVMDNRGTTIVVEPGKKFKMVAKNTLVHLGGQEFTQEVTQSTPVFEGSRMYYRAEQNLYCIGE